MGSVEQLENGGILHLFPYEKFTAGTINLLNSHFDPARHHFIVYGSWAGVQLRLQHSGNVQRQDSLLRWGLSRTGAKQLAAAGKIIVHSLSGPAAQLLLVRGGLLKKCYITFWGYELHGLREAKRPGARHALYRAAIRRAGAGAAGLCTLLPAEADTLRQLIEHTGPVFQVAYRSDTDFNALLARPLAEKPRQPARVLLGNNANRSNHHVAMLQKLAAYRGQGLQVVVPLNYGEADNREPVLKAGQRLLGEQFEPLTEFMPLPQYENLLAGCSAGLFDYTRQQALGNINTLAALGAKLYMQPGTVLWNTLAGQHGYRLHDIAEVGRRPLAELLAMPVGEAEHNRAALAAYANPARLAALWQKVFDDAPGPPKTDPKESLDE